jgi:hypothetical protein
MGPHAADGSGLAGFETRTDKDSAGITTDLATDMTPFFEGGRVRIISFVRSRAGAGAVRDKGNVWQRRRVRSIAAYDGNDRRRRDCVRGIGGIDSQIITFSAAH